MENFQQLSDFQQELVNGLVNELTKINPKPTNGASRFTLQTIKDCLQEKNRFKESITKHNLAMVEALVSQFKIQIQEFEEEFGEVVTVELGYKSPHNQNTRHNTLETMVEVTQKKPLVNNDFYETRLFFVSKTKAYKSETLFDYFKGNDYYTLYVDFKREVVRKTFEGGEVVSVYKIVGLEFYTMDYLGRKNKGYESFMSLDGLVQCHQPTQQKLIAFAQ